jgi:hypothetical protein
MAKIEEKKRKAILEAYAGTGSIRQTARKQKVTRKTVRRVLYGRRRPPAERPPAPSKLDPFRPTIQRLVLDDRLTATLVLDEIRELGYQKECGFEVALIAPGRPNQHASVERPFHYVENNCLRRRRFRFDDLDDLNRHAVQWCEQVANVRVHGSTRERPVDRLERERPLMLPLPSLRPEPCQAVGRKVGSDFCVAIDTNRYSVPPRHTGQPATVRLYSERLEVLVGGKADRQDKSPPVPPPKFCIQSIM